jgi:glycosyltransferase involved in cell wall biosynthesis
MTVEGGRQPTDDALPGPIMVVHNRYQQRAGEDAEVDAEIGNLADHGHEVQRFIVDNDSIRTAGLASKARLAVETVWSRRAARQLAEAVRRNRPAVVHIHNTFPLLSPAIYGALDKTGAAIVQSIHNYRPVCPSANLFRDGHDCTDCVGRRFAWPAIVHACYRDSRGQSAVVAAMLAAGRATRAWERAVDRFIAPSPTVADMLAGPAIPRDRIVVKPNFVGADPGAGSAGIRDDTYLYAGRLALEKGIGTIPAAWALLGNLAAACRLAGSGPLADQLAASAADDARVVPLGNLDRPALFEELRRARALIFPSIWREPFGLTIVEAFASGTPVIAARVGAPADLVEEGVTGLFFRPGDADDLAERIRWASGNPTEMAGMGRRARREYELRYSAEVNYAELTGVYRQALAHRRAAAEDSSVGKSREQAPSA